MLKLKLEKKKCLHFEWSRGLIGFTTRYYFSENTFRGSKFTLKVIFKECLRWKISNKFHFEDVQIVKNCKKLIKFALL